MLYASKQETVVSSIRFSLARLNEGVFRKRPTIISSPRCQIWISVSLDMPT